MSGDHIRIEIFDDRIEISSPGRFPGLVGMSDPLEAPRFARNPRHRPCLRRPRVRPGARGGLAPDVP
ncbi:MAG: ATP-binding protein [Solirubrobacteraceae bacterium]